MIHRTNVDCAQQVGVGVLTVTFFVSLCFKMWGQCCAISAILLVVSLASKLIVETSDNALTTQGRKMIERALHWKSVASAETDDLLVYQHLTTSLAFVQAGRELMSDTDLERCTGIHVTGLASDLESRMMRQRQNARTSSKGS